VAESWFALSAEDQKEALAVAAAESGWPAYLLEKDIWVVWALQILGTDQQLLRSLTFKGGTSLSKAHGLIDRFSEDVDLTVNIQHLWPDVLAPAVNPSQAERRRKAADSKLKQWVREIPMPLLQGAVSAAGIPVKLTLKAAELRRRQPPTIVLHYPPLIPAPVGTYGYVRPTVLLEFGAHSTGEPHGPMPITCEAAAQLAMLDFPTARPLVMDPKRTFLEKAAAIHVSCRRGRWGSGEGDRYSRHWYDLDRLARAGIAEEAVRDDLGAIALGAAVLPHHPPDEAFRSPVTLLQDRDSPAATLRAQKFLSARSLSIAFSISASARSFLSRAFSFSSWVRRLASQPRPRWLTSRLPASCLTALHGGKGRGSLLPSILAVGSSKHRTDSGHAIDR
jgi:hypothetical protein